MRMLKPRTMRPARNPPTVEMNTRPQTSAFPPKNTRATAHVVTPMATLMTRVSAMAESKLARRTVPRFRLISNVPMFMAVPILLPMAPNMFPRMPMAE